MLGRDPTFLLGKDQDQTGAQQIERALRERREGHVMLKNYCKDGTLFWHEYYTGMTGFPGPTVPRPQIQPGDRVLPPPLHPHLPSWITRSTR